MSTGRFMTGRNADAWLNGIAEWPRTVSWIDRLGVVLADALDEPIGKMEVPVCSVPGLLLRNLIFLVTVLAHGLRRLLPPC